MSRTELVAGINNSAKLDDTQRKVLIYLVTNENKPTEEEINQVFSILTWPTCPCMFNHFANKMFHFFDRKKIILFSL